MSRLLTIAVSIGVMLCVDLAARAGPWEWAWLSVSYSVGYLTALALTEEENGNVPKR